MSTALLNTPIWNQLNDPNPNGAQDQYDYEDCGFECAAMVAYACTAKRPNITEGALREMLGNAQGQGWRRRGLTQPSDVVQVLGLLGVKAHARTGIDTATAFHEWNDSIAAGLPCIILGTWDGAAEHWMVLVDSPSGPNWVVNDPWGGVRKTISDSFVAANFQGSYVHVDQPAV